MIVQLVKTKGHLAKPEMIPFCLYIVRLSFRTKYLIVQVESFLVLFQRIGSHI